MNSGAGSLTRPMIPTIKAASPIGMTSKSTLRNPRRRSMPVRIASPTIKIRMALSTVDCITVPLCEHCFKTIHAWYVSTIRIRSRDSCFLRGICVRRLWETWQVIVRSRTPKDDGPMTPKVPKRLAHPSPYGPIGGENSTTTWELPTCSRG